ncbi:class I SAM-dependent methyltransferase [Chromatocurvus halotolerans]|uniref:Methyltransferase family protein n=1 Tax=Chromatocurvus halotolerans TaxID=1132028 RepID=A0A4R2L030_9GAMM|nr:class I SAM-dependent methyltransferase [Chromatocurvus halotolerans]TCO77016.1 methyltransferase family protein [Chromatocurvus halotolerans]
MSADDLRNDAAGPDARGAWSDYWREGDTEHALPDDNPGTRALAEVWRGYAAELASRAGRARIVDLACGGGFALRHLEAASQAPSLEWELFGLDIAAPALEQLRKGAATPSQLVVGDAARPPFADGSMNVVLSQFGLEYAGQEALSGAARLLAPAGELLLLVHHADGPVAASCSANRDIVEAVLACGALEAMRHWFEQRASGRQRPLARSQAAEKLREPISAMESLLQQSPQCPARQLAGRMHADLARLYTRAGAYATADVMPWLDGMHAELVSYRQRMQGMLQAARDAADTEQLLSDWTSQGLQHCDAGVIEVEGQPLAWKLTATRPAA